MGKISGALFFLAGFVLVMGIITAEIFYPGYSISKNFISNLGSTRPPVIIIHQPSAIIFDTIMIATGLLLLAGGLLFSTKDKVLKVMLLIMGAGSLCVGIFPAYYGIFHDLIAGVAFAAAGIAAILSSKIVNSPFKYISILLGAITLIFLILGVFFSGVVVPTLGDGGVERWVAYPTIIWMMGFGGYLMGSKGLVKGK